MELTQMIFIRKPALKLLAWLLITIAVLGVAASCDDNGGQGMHQGGSDSEPHWH